MTNIKEIVYSLREFNRWRRGADGIPQPNPEDVGVLIDQAAYLLEKLIPQPIETAPRDETDVWLYDVDYDDYPHVGYYDPEFGWVLLDRKTDNFNPTHWWPAKLFNVGEE